MNGAHAGAEEVISFPRSENTDLGAPAFWFPMSPKSGRDGAPGTRELKLLFDFYCNHADLGCADVFERVWSKRRYPEGSARQRRCRASTVERDVPALVAANEFAYAENVERGRPEMGMQRGGLAGQNDGVKDANAIVLEEELVIFGRGSQRIEF